MGKVVEILMTLDYRTTARQAGYDPTAMSLGEYSKLVNALSIAYQAGLFKGHELTADIAWGQKMEYGDEDQ